MNESQSIVLLVIVLVSLFIFSWWYRLRGPVVQVKQSRLLKQLTQRLGTQLNWSRLELHLIEQAHPQLTEQIGNINKTDFELFFRRTFGSGYLYEFHSIEPDRNAVTVTSRYSPEQLQKMKLYAEQTGRAKTEWEFVRTLLDLIKFHFGRPYLLKPNDKIKAYGVEVFRPNHPLDHGIRQGRLSGDIIRLVGKYPDEFRQDIVQLVAAQTDLCKFIRQMQFTGAFQRSGRESEGNVAENYQAYARADVGFFRQAARYSSLFDDQLQIDDFANALTAACDYLAEPHVMGDIMAAAHMLDLQRIGLYGEKDSIIAAQLLNANTQLMHNSENKGGTGGSQVIRELRQLTDCYLVNNGILGFYRFEKKWYMQNNDLDLMAQAVVLDYSKPLPVYSPRTKKVGKLVKASRKIFKRLKKY